ncbi:hypothetical protein MMC10_003045 [Thelotrema lepadinum]|nr:hypothetical protein [Thelotrema lepadinum]
MELFVPAKKANKTYWVCQGLIWFNLAFYLALTLVEIFACQPFNKIWDPLVTDGWCVNYISLEFYASLINTISDLVIFVLPQLVIWRLHMSLRRKVALSSLFVIGVVAVTASIVRLAYTIILFTSTDTSYYFHFAGTWSIPEVALGIVVACLPMLPKFFQSMNQGSIVTRLGYSIRSLMGKSSSGSRGTTEAIPMQDESDSPSNHRGTRRYQRYPDDTIRTSTLSENNPGDTEKIAPLDSVATGK